MGGFGFPFPADPNDPNLVMDRGGFTGRGPLIPRRQRRPGDPADPTDQGYGAQDPEFAPPASGPVPPRQTATPLPDSGYSELTDLTHAGARHPTERGVGYRILGALASRNPISAGFADDITYGSKAASAKHDWEQDVALQQMRNKAGQSEQQNVLHGRQLDDSAQWRQQQQLENQRWHDLQDQNRDQANYSQAQDRLGKQGARGLMPDIPTEYGTIPGRAVGAGGGRVETLPPRKGMPADQVYVPSPAQWKQEQAQARGGTLDPAVKKYIGGILQGLPADHPLHTIGDEFTKMPDGQPLTDSQMRNLNHVIDSAEKLYGVTSRANNFTLGPQGERYSGGKKVAGNTQIPTRVSSSTTTSTTTNTTAKEKEAQDQKANAHYSRIAAANPGKTPEELGAIVAQDPQVVADNLTAPVQAKIQGQVKLQPKGKKISSKLDELRKKAGVSAQAATSTAATDHAGKTHVKRKSDGLTGWVTNPDLSVYDKI